MILNDLILPPFYLPAHGYGRYCHCFRIYLANLNSLVPSMLVIVAHEMLIAFFRSYLGLAQVELLFRHYVRLCSLLSLRQHSRHSSKNTNIDIYTKRSLLADLSHYVNVSLLTSVFVLKL